VSVIIRIWCHLIIGDLISFRIMVFGLCDLTRSHWHHSTLIGAWFCPRCILWSALSDKPYLVLQRQVGVLYPDRVIAVNCTWRIFKSMDTSNMLYSLFSSFGSPEARLAVPTSFQYNLFVLSYCIDSQDTKQLLLKSSSGYRFRLSKDRRRDQGYSHGEEAIYS